MSLTGKTIFIIGAGIAGLAVARAFALRGARVRVFEQAAVISEVGAGLQISPNGLAVLRALDLQDALSKIATKAEAVQLRDYRAGRDVLRIDLTQLPDTQFYSFVHRADLIDLLATAARDVGVDVQAGVRIDDIKCGTTPSVSIDEQIHGCDILIGADGLNSVVRHVLNGTVAPFFTHQVAWRALVPADGAASKQVNVHMGPGRHLVTYPLRDESLINIVAVEERGDWAEEGWYHQDDPDNLRHAFSNFSNDIKDLIKKVDVVNLWGLFRHPVAESWHRGHVAILGDAAHPTLPFLAQGANMALEDAWVLAASLDANDEIEHGLAEYQSHRHARVSRVIDAASKNARNYHLRFPPLRWAAHTALRLGGSIAPSAPLRRFDWLYGEDVTLIDGSGLKRS
ncbi:FAD-dependent monooxygenase [Parasulfitobacter algicola]|uniref:FAD-dependent monooxygenase n=1 Tax=Parasulfitobacter algicola TaxID=2614809 RepID=A0ABX2IYW8_9RHOB|nr:FAD-dependent monooxygenase [Sulfitobacter algicola]NSX56392.1 FAD-dependent monooxygenase [Sulfitobacter algicola]